MRVKHAVAAVRSFAREGDLGAGTIELCAPFDQFFYTRRAFLNQNACCLFVAKSVASLQCVVEMQADFIVVA